VLIGVNAPVQRLLIALPNIELRSAFLGICPRRRRWWSPAFQPAKTLRDVAGLAATFLEGYRETARRGVRSRSSG
jgi:hypothetical protein